MIKYCENDAKCNNLKAVKKLIKNGNIHYDEDLALRVNAYFGNTEAVILLIENGASIHVIDVIALRVSARYGHLEVVKYLLKNGAFIHAMEDYALRESVCNGHLEVAQCLLENGAFIHIHDDSPLQSCCHFMWNGDAKYVEMVKLLIKNGAHIDVDNNLALRLSVIYLFSDLVDFLIENGADIHADDDYVFQWCSDRSKVYLDGIKILVERGANIYANDNYAIRNCIDKPDIINYLLPLYRRKELKKIFLIGSIRNPILKFVKSGDVKLFPLLISLYRDYGVDIYDMIEKEQIKN